MRPVIDRAPRMWRFARCRLSEGMAQRRLCPPPLRPRKTSLPPNIKTKTTTMPKSTLSTGVSGSAIGLSRLECQAAVLPRPTVPPRSPRAEASKPLSLVQAVEAHEPGSTVTTPLDSLQNRYAHNVMNRMKNENTPSHRHIKLHRHESLSRRDAA